MTQSVVSPHSETLGNGLKNPLTPPIVLGIVGPSNSGKTQLAANLIREFKAMSPGLRLAAIKHCPHGHNVDHDGSDTARLRNAGATSTVASSPGAISTFSVGEGEVELDALITRLSRDHEVILVEGYKTSQTPKILLTDDPSQFSGISNVVATVGSLKNTRFNVRNFTNGDTAQLAQWIATNPVLRQGCQPVSLRIDGEPISLKRFPSEVLAGIVRGFVDSLNGVPDDYSQIEISISPDNDAR